MGACPRRLPSLGLALLVLSALPAPASAQATGGISGTVTDAATGAPLGGVSILVYRALGDPAGQDGTDYSGIYTVSGLAPGAYYVRTSAGAPYVDKLYDDLPCPIHVCAPTGGTAVNVTAGATATGVNFSLVLGGKITGIVSAAATGEPLVNVRVQAYTAEGSSAGISGTTDASGTYTITWLETGSYFLKTSYTFPYLDELYKDVPCPDGYCEVTAGTSVGATAGATTEGINIALTRGATIAGTVTASATGSPISGVRVDVYNENGASNGWALTDDTGAYSVTGLKTGTYYAATSNAAPYSDELYNDLPCQPGNCVVTSGMAIIATAGATVAGIDFALSGGGTIAGTVTDAASGAPLANIRLVANTPDGTKAGEAISGASGQFAITDLTTGTYHVRTLQTFPYLAEVYDNLPCENGSCAWTLGTDIAVASGSTTGGISFALTRGGSIAGAVTATATGAPLAGVGIGCYDATGLLAGLATTDAAGSYTVQGLPTGTYFARAQADPPYAGELYNELLCPAPGCTVTSGTAIAVTAGAIRSGINFSLALTGEISGTVTARETGSPIANAGIGVFTAAGQPAGSASTDAAGEYTVNGLPPATYYVRAGKAPDFRGALYDNKPCHPNCDLVTGTGVVVSPASMTAGIDFALDRAGDIAGTVRNNAGTPIANVVVMAFDANGAAVGGAVTDASGSYSIPFLEAGGYYVRTLDALPYVGQLYEGKPCSPSCLVTSGTLVTVSLNHTTSGIDFGLSIAGSIAGSVRQGVAGPPLADVQVTVFNASGMWAGSSTTDASGTYAVSGLASGTWYVRASRGLPFLDQMYDGRSCTGADCVPANGTGVTVSSGSVTGGVDFSLRTPAHSDFDGNLKSDILWRHEGGGDLWQWPMDGATRLSERYVKTIVDTNWEIRALGDVNASTTADLLWRNKVTGEIYHWLMDGATPSAEIYVATVDPAYDIAGMGDFNGDGIADILWRHATAGDVWIWLMEGQVPTSETFLDRVEPGYVIRGVGDLDGDSKADIVWHHATTGEVWVWSMDGTARRDQVWVGTVSDTGYQIEGVADFDGNSKADLVWWHATRGEVWVWTMNGPARAAETRVSTVPDITYQIAGTGDYDGDGRADLLWRNVVNGEIWMWLMSGPVRLSETWVATVPDVGYHIIR